MTKRNSGKQWALNITTAVTVGSFAVVGIGAIAVDQATGSHAASTKSGTSDDNGGTSQIQAPSHGSGSYLGYSGGSSVQSGNDGPTNGTSSGS
ncbi:hypothetical protein [Arthrobacter sp. lap29]|uniref:hypothetical protein n=1 Tax=Arthrobacter sp. lap29 TaxID=3056122 RepID=UPI0028F72E51|nr:hypothetical protein [Arthrobacter sp. lap29]